MRVAGILAWIVIGSWCSPALAFRTAADLPGYPDDSRVRWATSRIEYVINEEGAPGVSLGDVATTAQETLAKWSHPSCSAVSFDYDGSTPNPAMPEDGFNTIQWLSTGWDEKGFDPSAAGVTDIAYERNPEGEWEIVEADLYVNAEYFGWVADGQPPAGKRDIASLLLHESGHMLGLLHPCEIEGDGAVESCIRAATFDDAVMHPLYSAARTTLSSDDQAGVCHLYPKADCTSTGCPRGASCQDGQCRPLCLGKLCDLGEVCSAEGCSIPERPDNGNERPEGAAFGESCNAAADCADDLCVASRMASTGTCSRACGPSSPACPEDWSCADVDDERVCLPTPVPRGGGCTASGTRASGLAEVIAIMASLLVLRRQLVRRVKEIRQ